MKDLKKVREFKKITQEELAKEIDISLTHYRNIERKRSVPNVVIAIKIARLLNERVEELFEIC